MGYSFKSVLKMGTTACLALALVGPSTSRSQTGQTSPPTTAPAATSALPTTPSSPVTPPAAPTTICERIGHVSGQKRADWNSDNYLCEIIQALSVEDIAPVGLPGGVEKKIVLPRGAFLTKVHVFSDDKRVYGLKFSYKLRGGPNDDEIDTDVIGGTSGGVLGGDSGTEIVAKNVVELTYDTPLHFIRPRFGSDPAGHYNRPVMVGLDIGYYKFNPLAPSYVADPSASFSHSDMIEVKRFGATGRGTPPVAQSGGFDVHLVQIIRGINACISPYDRNGRIMSLGVTVSGVGVARNATNPTMCPPAGGTTWENQPLGPKRIVIENLGRTDPYQFTRGRTDAQDFASGIYTRIGDDFQVIPGSNASSNDYRGARFSVPQSIMFEFGDTARVAFGNVANAVFNNVPLITDPARLTRNGRTFDFAYGSPGFFVGVELKTIASTNPVREKTYAYVTFETNDPNGRKYNGRYEEARLGDQSTDMVTKRDGGREANAAAKESAKSLFSLGTTQTGFGYIYAGYDAVSMSAFDHNSGVKIASPIFAVSGAFQYYLSSTQSKAVYDGLYMVSIKKPHTERTQTMLSSESEVADTLSRSISADVNIRGVKVGGKYTKTQANSLTRSANSMMGIATAQYFDFALGIDRPNAFLTDKFKSAMQDLYNADDARVRATFAQDMITNFGTHFSNTIIFGGMGTLLTEIDANTVAQKRETGEAITLSAGFDPAPPGAPPGPPGAPAGKPVGAPVTGQTEFSQSRTNTNNNSSASSKETASFVARGGSGSFNAEGWSVSEGNAVPIYYDLRGLDELVEPIIMSKALGTRHYEVARGLLVRDALRLAIENRFREFPPPANTSNKRPFFKLTILGLSCDHAGGDGLNFNSLFLGQGKESTNRIQLYGTLDIVVTSGVGDGTQRDQPFNLLNSPGTNNDLKCDNTVNPNIAVGVPVFTYALDSTLPYLSIASRLFEDDDSLTDPDDKIDGSVMDTAPSDVGVPKKGRMLISGDMLSAADAGSQGRLQKPKVYLNYEWVRLE